MGATLDRVRGQRFDQRLVAIGAAADLVRAAVDLNGFTVVESVHHTTGCSSSIVASLGAIGDDIDGFLLFLGDQPDVPDAAIDGLRAASGKHGLAVVRYRDGRGHPFWFARSLFPDLRELHGDKAVWKLLESGRWPVHEVGVDAEVPIDVDTWDDYMRLLAT